MAEHIGIVLKIEQGGYARVVTDRRGACGGCQPGGGCRSCLAGAKLESRVANPVRAKEGDLVKVQLSTTNLFAGAAILYLLPVFGLLFGAIMGGVASPGLGWNEVHGSIGGALGGLAVGFLIVRAVDRNPVVRRRIMPAITTVVRPNVGLPVIFGSDLQ